MQFNFENGKLIEAQNVWIYFIRRTKRANERVRAVGYQIPFNSFIHYVLESEHIEDYIGGPLISILISS